MKLTHSFARILSYKCCDCPEISMFCYILLVFVNLSLSVHSNLYTNNNYSIQMTLTKALHRGYHFEAVQKEFKILLNKSFNITLVNYVATSARCSTDYYDFMSTFTCDDGDSTIKFSEATKDMTAKWQCAVETNDSSVLLLKFYVRVIGGPKKVQIEIAGRKISTTVSGSPEFAYDQLGIYYYKEGETVQLICKNNNGRQQYGNIYLRYYDSKDKIILETDGITDDDSAFFQRTMKPEDDDHAIDCTYVTRDTNLMFPYRVVFKLINDSIDDDFITTINDLKLRPTETPLAGNKKMRRYQFTYFQNQTLTVCFETSNKKYCLIRFVDEDNKTSKIREIKTTQSKDTVQFHTIFTERKQYVLLDVYEGVSNPFPIAKVYLIESSYPELLIRGLTAKDVIDQYRKNSTTWIIDYWYSVGETLYLSCISKDKRYLQWLFGKSLVHHEYSKIISNNFTLREESNETSIICEDLRQTKNDRRTIINLHRKSLYAVTSDYPSPTDEDSDKTILILCATVASILAVTTLGVVFYHCRQRNVKSSQTTTNTLTNEKPKTYDNSTAEYHYIDVKDVSKETYATARPISPQADNVFVNSLAKSQKNENNDNSKRTTAEVGLNPCDTNIAKDEEDPQSANNEKIYDYAYSHRYW